MQLPPDEIIRSWPAPNYTNPITHGNVLLIITLIFFPLSILTIALRTFTRLCISKRFGSDDVFLLAAIPSTVAASVLTILADRKWGWDRHIWDVPGGQLTFGLKMDLAKRCCFIFSSACYEVSLLILTRKIMTSGSEFLRRLAVVGIFVVSAEGLASILVTVFGCTPVSAYWTLSTGPQNCINVRLSLLIGGGISTAIDFLVFFLPLVAVLKLKIARRQQVVLCVLFGAGFSVCVTGIVKVILLRKITRSFDVTWDSYGLAIASVLELHIGIICTAIPACNPFFTRYLPGLLGPTLEVTELDVHNKHVSRLSSSLADHSHHRKTPSVSSLPHIGSPNASEQSITQPAAVLELDKLSLPQRISMRFSPARVSPSSFLDEYGVVDENHSVEPRESHDTSLSSFRYGSSMPPRSTRSRNSGVSGWSSGAQDLEAASISDGEENRGRSESREGLVWYGRR